MSTPLRSLAEDVVMIAKASMTNAPSPRQHAPKGRPPFVQSGNLRRSINVWTSGTTQKIYVDVENNGVPYGYIREVTGNPFLMPALRAVTGNRTLRHLRQVDLETTDAARRTEAMHEDALDYVGRR